MKNNSEEIINKIFNKYKLDISEQQDLKRMIKSIYKHPEFERRMTREFLHHADITLGEHIIEDSVLTYILSKKYQNKKYNYNYRLDLAVKISMFHDLYTIPWQNNSLAKVHHFFNKHGFRHPLEAAINAITWYPNAFANKNDAEIIIDGILHHMFPLPVRRINGEEIDKLELKNINNYQTLPYIMKQILINSLNQKRIGSLSFSRSLFKEGRIMAKADRIVSRRQIKDLSSFKALFTGKNKKIS